MLGVQCVCSGSDEDYNEAEQAGAASDAAQVSRYRYCCRVFPELWHLNVGVQCVGSGSDED